MLVEIDHPTRGRYVQVGMPIKLSDSPAEVKRSPLLGEHTDEVLGWLGYGDGRHQEAARRRRGADDRARPDRRRPVRHAGQMPRGPKGDSSMRSATSTRPPHPSRLGAAARPRHAEGPAGRSGGARRGAGAARRARAPARPADRASASAAGPFRLPACAASGGAGRGDAAGAGRGLRGRLVLRPFRHRDGRRGAAAAGHRAGLRQPDLRAVRRRDGCSTSCATGSATGCGSCGRRAWAAATRRRSSRSATRCTSTRRSTASPRRWRPAHTHPQMPAYPGLDALSRRTAATRCCRAACPAARTRRERDRGAGDIRAARARRRRVSDRAQMALRAAGAGAAADGGQCRRGRARHVQGPLFSRNRPAPLSRRHADRRLGGRGRRHLHLSARRIPAMPRDPRHARSPRSRRRGWRRTPRSICGAAPAPISAARNRRCSKASRASAGCRATSRRFRRRSGCSAGRP